MKEITKVNLINTILRILGILGIFFSGYMIAKEILFYLPLFIFIGSVFILSAEAVLTGEGHQKKKIYPRKKE